MIATGLAIAGGKEFPSRIGDICDADMSGGGEGGSPLGGGGGSSVSEGGDVGEFPIIEGR